MTDQIDATVHSMEASRLDAVPNGAATEAGLSKLVQRHDSPLPRGERRYHPVGMCFVVIYTLSLHITTTACAGSARQRVWRSCGGGG